MRNEFFYNFRDLQNYTTLKRIGKSMGRRWRFRGLQNYTTLKQEFREWMGEDGFRGLQNDTTLKRMLSFSGTQGGF